MRSSGYLHMANVSSFYCVEQNINQGTFIILLWLFECQARCLCFQERGFKTCRLSGSVWIPETQKASALSLTLASRRKSIPIWNCEYRPTRSFSTLLTILHFHWNKLRFCIAMPRCQWPWDLETTHYKSEREN